MRRTKTITWRTRHPSINSRRGRRSQPEPNSSSNNNAEGGIDYQIKSMTNLHFVGINGKETSER